MALDIEKYRKLLIAERDRLAQEIPPVSEIAQPVPDQWEVTAADAPLISEIKDVQNEIVSMKSDRLNRVQAALDRIDDGTYGICIRCGKPIDPRRLDVEPSATACMDCLSAEEENFETATM
jgi:DnaK suppressor protein